MIKKYVILIMVLMMLAFLVGCHLDIQSDVNDPTDIFTQTQKKIQAIHAKNPGRKGTVTNLNMLVYESEDRQLISFSVPITTAKETIKGVSNLEDLAHGEKIKKYTKKIGGIKLDNLNILDRIGPGLVLEAEVNEGKKSVRALIWLD
jgi:hypothetical protein